MKKVRNIRWHTVLIDTPKTETSNFVLNPSLHWKPVRIIARCDARVALLTRERAGWTQFVAQC